MRTIVVFMWVVSLVGSEKLKYEPNFTESLTHVYKYEGVILTGLPEGGLSRAGVKIHCGLSIIPEGHAMYLLKVTDVQMLEYNGVWPTDPFILGRKLTQRLAPELSKPVRFEYINGRVGKVFAPANLPEDILNIHRGILNIFQITIKKAQNFYELQEAGIEGVCRTNYIVQEDKKANRITVTKSKDLNNCQEKVMLFTGAAYASHCPVFQERGRNIRASVTFTHVLKPTAAGAILQEAKVREVHQFTPFHELDGTAIIEARQSLVLVDVKSAVFALPHDVFIQRGTVKYRYHQGVLHKPLQLNRPQNVEKAILETLKALEAHSVENVRPDTPAKFLQLVQLLRSAPQTTTASVWDKASGSRARCWILFALPAVGTADALRFITTKIQRLEVTMQEAARTLALALHQVTADLHTLRLVTELLGAIHVQQSAILRPIIVLGYGSMVYRYCAHRITCPDHVLKLLHDLLADAVAHGNEEDMALALKAIGNAGQPVSIKHIVKLLPWPRPSAPNVPLKSQVDGIMALRNILKKDPTKIQVITLHIFMDQRNAPELRMAACAVFLCTKPPLNALLLLANSLMKESSLQVASFAYSQLRSLSRSSLPSLYPLAAACKMVVKFLGARFDRLGLRFSQSLHLDGFSYKLMTGVSGKVLVIHNEGSIIPSMAAAKVSGHTLGGVFDLMEVGLRMEGLQEVITKSRERFSGVPDLKQIQRILNKFPDLKPAAQTVPLASVYFKMFNQEIGFVDFRRDYIHKALQSLSGMDGKRGMLRKFLEQLRKPLELRPGAALVAMELRRFVPTCVGMSTELTLVSAAVAKADLNVEAKIPTSTSSLTQLLNADIELKTQINLSVAIHSKAVLGINTPFLQSGLELTAKMHSALPLDVSVKVNVKEGSLRMDSLPVQQEKQIITLKSEVFAVSRSIENLVPVKVSPILPGVKEANIVHQKFKSSQESRSEADIYSALGMDGAECLDKAQRPAPKPSHLTSCISMTTFGLEMCVDTKLANALYVRHSPLYRLLGTHAARLLVKPVPAHAPITKLTLELQTGSKAASKMVRPLEKEELPLQQTPGTNVFMEMTRSQSRLQDDTVIGSSSSSSHSRQGSSWSWSSSSSGERTPGGRKAGGQRHWSSAHGSGLHSHSVSGSRRINTDFFEMKFNSVHTSEVASKRQSAGRTLSSKTRQQPSSSQSSEELLSEELGTPSLTIIAKATTSDGRLQGYQLSGTVGSARGRPRVQLRIVELAEDSRWKMCVDAASPNPHKAMVMYRWGENCQRYKMEHQASLGYLANLPAIKLKTTWNSIPEGCITGGRVYELLHLCL